MPGATARLAMPLPLGADAVSELRLAITAIANTLDSAAMARSGTLSARPAANTLPTDTLYRCTDTPAWFVTDGTTWHYVPLDGNSQPVGAITQYAGTADPVDVDGTTRWMICNGRTLSATSFPTLSTRIGTTYGGTVSNFNIPDLRGRVPVGVDSGGTHLPTNHPALGASGGEEQHILAVTELPSHTHPLAGDSGDNMPLTNTSFVGTNISTTPGSIEVVEVAGEGAMSNTRTSGHTGGSVGHNVLQPYLAVNHIIRVL